MSRICLAVAVAAFLAGSVWAAPPTLKIPADNRPVDGMVIIEPETTAKAVTYVPLSGVSPFPSRLLADKKVFVLSAKGLKDGVYEFVAVGSLDDEHTTARFAVVVGAAPPGPAPIPGPQPAPNPPGPQPQPTPPAPAPTGLAKVIADALAVDVAAGRGSKEKLAALGEVYESSAGLLQLNDPAVAPRTVGEVYQKTFAASVTKGVPRLPYFTAVRDAVNKHVGDYDGTRPLTDALRDELSQKYLAVGAALKEASK